MKGATARVAAWVVAVLPLFSIYGMATWFFPSEIFIAIVFMPVAGAGLVAAYSLCRNRRDKTEEYKRLKIRKSILCVAFFCFLPVFLWLAVGLGIPAMVTKVMGPDREILATISVKDRGQGRRTCGYRLGLEGYSTLFKDNFCVTEEDFRRVEIGQEVRLLARQDFFGTRIFEINTK